jgi:hypothetical protein
MKGAARRVLDVLGLQGVVIPEEGSGPEVTFVVGRDAAHCPGLLFADSLDDLPDAPRSVVRRIDPDDEQLFPRRRRRRSADEPVRVNVEPAPEPEQEEEPPPGEGLSIPGTADPPPPAEPPPTTELPGGA